jgi:uncharacterized lipoprotein YmbA
VAKWSVILAVLVLSGCSSPEAAAPAPTVVVSPSDPAADEPPGTITCGHVIEAVRDGTLMSDGVIVQITATSTTADAPVADAARRLSESYQAALAAHGAADEPDKVAAVSARAAEMVSVCRDSGLETTG